MESVIKYEELVKENERLRFQLEEASETIDAIRTGQVDALVVEGEKGHELYTLKTADQTYRVFIEKMTEGAVTLNPDGIILYSNSRFAAMVNMPLSKVIGLSFKTFIAPGNADEFHALFERGWKEDCKGEIVLVSNEISIVFQLSLTTLQLDEGFSLSIILTDLTVQKETQKQLKLNNEQLEEINHALEVSNHDLQQFASVASHDLQEPLRKINLYSNLLATSHADEFSDVATSYLEKIISSSNRMRALIVDILSYSRLSDNTNQYKLTPLTPMVTELLDDFEIMIEDKKAQISVGELPVMEVNPGQMRQVFQNLISNALKFSKKDESPVISIYENKFVEHLNNGHQNNNGAYTYISVKDNGIGFDEKYISNVFTLFKRLHGKDRYEGSGIGLAITKKIIEKHNGHIVVRSKEGEGSEFTIVLPITQNSQ